MAVDFGKTAKDYARHRAGFPEAFFARLGQLGLIDEGLRVLDLGCGTGTVARGCARMGCQVTGLDPSDSMIGQAQELDREAGISITYRTASAEETGLQTESFDLVTAGQCWHWFDRPRATEEAHRLLQPGGNLLIAHFDWLPLAGNMVEATEALILKHNPAWKGAGGKGVYPWWFTDLAEGGFQDIESFSFDLPAVYSHEDWRGRIRASAGVAASLPPEQVEQFDQELGALLTENFPEPPLQVPHRVFALWGKREG